MPPDPERSGLNFLPQAIIVIDKSRGSAADNLGFCQTTACHRWVHEFGARRGGTLGKYQLSVLRDI